jgi:hypothetical protein
VQYLRHLPIASMQVYLFLSVSFIQMLKVRWLFVHQGRQHT